MNSARLQTAQSRDQQGWHQWNRDADRRLTSKFNLRFQHAINQLENPGRIEAVKKDIARVMTVLAEKQ